MSPTAETPGLQVNLSIANPPASGLYYGSTFLGTAVTSAGIDWSPYLVNGAQQGYVEVMLESPAFMGSGTFHDTVTVCVCTDSKCVNQIAGSPVSIAITYTVSGNAISDATYAIVPTTIALESPSNGAALTTTVNVTAYEVPPYGAYVFYTSESGGPVASMSFQQTSANSEPYAYGTGVLTVNMKIPATLGPGVYSDLITLSICYDSGCTKPAVGTPYEIPVTYTITASAGREFQQQIIEQNLTALAVDPSGTVLYGVTAPANASTGSGTPAQLLKIDPATGAVTTLLNLPTAVSQIEVSQDGSYLYLLTEFWLTSQLSPPIQVIRVRTSDMSIDQTVPLTNDTVVPAQIAVSPVDSNTWSAAFASLSNIFVVDIFDGSTVRPQAWSVTRSLDYGNEALWSADGSTMYISDGSLDAVPVSAGGLAGGMQLLSGSAAQGNFDSGGIQLAAGLIYSDGGQVLNPATDAILGQYSFPSGVPYADLTIDPSIGRTFAAYTAAVNDTSEGTIQSFDLSAFTPIWIARLPIGSQPLRWGSNGLAWIGPGATAGVQALYLINGTFVAP